MIMREFFGIYPSRLDIHMPEIMIAVHVKPELLNLTQPQEDWSPKQKLVASIVEKLPEDACIVINDAQREESNQFRRPFGSEDVRLLIVPIHAWSRNVPDLSAEIRFDGIAGDKKEPQDRRWSIARDISGKIFHRLDEDVVYMLHQMSYLIECTLLPSSGIVRSNMSHGKWGTPDYGAPRPHYVPDRDEGRGDNSDDDPYQPPTR